MRTPTRHSLFSAVLLLSNGLCLAAPGDILFQYPANNLTGWTTTSNGGDASIGTETAQAGSSLRLRWGQVEAVSPAINAQVPAAQLELWIRRGDDSFSENPDQDDDLRLEYLANSGSWTTLATYAGGDTPGEILTPTFVLPVDARHAALQLRLSMLDGSGQDWDYWHIDDVTITELAVSGGFGLGTCADFETGLGGWSISSGTGSAGVSSATANSPNNSLFTRWGTVTVTSPVSDLSGVSAAQLGVWVRRGDDNFSEDPDPGEDLVIEFLRSDGSWQTLETFSGNGQRGQIFQRNYALPGEASHGGFQVRLRQLDGDGPDNDYWHVDDVCLSSPLLAAYQFEAAGWTGASGEVADSSGNGFDGTVFGSANTDGAAPAISGDPGTCRYADFDGIDDYIQIDDNPLLDLASTFTVSAWINMRTLPSGLHTILSKDWNYEYHINSAGQIYWWWNDDNGNTRTITTSQSISLNTWHHVAITYAPGDQRIYLDGVEVDNANFPGDVRLNDVPVFIGTDWNFISRAFDGNIDEVRIFGTTLGPTAVQALMTDTHPCPSVGAEFQINHDNFGIHCLAETITVDVTDANAGTPLTSYNSEITLDTQTGDGTWSLVTGSGSLTDAVTGDGLATYAWPLGESQAVFQLSYIQGTPSMDVDVFQTSDTGVRDDDSEGTLVFTASGFTLTAGALSNPPPNLIVPFNASQTAAVDFPVHISAYGQTPNDPACGIIESYSGTRPLQFWQGYSNPATGSRVLSVDGNPIAAAEAGASPQNVIFNNGQAVVNAAYKDVGAISFSVKDESSGNPGLPQGIRGGTADFVVRPARYSISDIRNAAGTVINLGATNANGPIFVPAGAPFRMTVTALDADGDPVPNYGQESPAETVRLGTQLLAPAGGSAPSVSAATGFGAFTGGAAVGFDFVWPEVGIMRVVPAVGDADYLGSGDVIGDPSVEIGRFIPDHFTTTQNLPLFASGCSAGGFTYIGQSFGYVIPPVITATARAQTGTATLNYTGAFFKLATSTLQNRQYQTSQGTLDLGGIPPATADPSVAETTPGTASLSFSAGSGIRYVRATPVPPFDAVISLSIDVVDDDAVSALGNPIIFDSGPGIAFNSGPAQRYGRIRIGTAVGSELVDLPVVMTAEYFASAGQGFAPHTDDSCSNGVSLGFSGFTESLNLGDTCVLDSGAPGLSNIGCPAPSATPYREPPLAGDFRLILAAPGATNTGGVVITSDVPTWLRFDWNTLAPGNENPTGQATFGLYPGEGRHIYQREVY